MTSAELTDADYLQLHAFRSTLRRFFRRVEAAAREAGLEPQQHQMLLAIRALSISGTPAVGDLAEELGLRHQSAVELLDRLAKRGLAERVRSESDRRVVTVRLSPAGEAVLSGLSASARSELETVGPELIRALSNILGEGRSS